MEQKLSKKTRTESDLIGSREVPESALYGVQTLRGIENFRISKFHLNEYPLFIQALAITKMGAAVANRELELLTEEQTDAILKACKEILEGKHHDQFPVDMIQGGAGTTTNMNANEVIANRALELMGHARGEYQYCSPNDHVNRSQSTNDAYPTAIPSKATVAAEMGLAVIACCEAITAIPSGRSGRIFVSVATSAITGNTE